MQIRGAQGGSAVTGNWKLDAIIQALAEADAPLPSQIIAENLPGVSPKQLSNYIKHNVLHKYVEAERVSLKGDSCAPWLNFYTLTNTGQDRYNRLIKERTQ